MGFQQIVFQQIVIDPNPRVAQRTVTIHPPPLISS